MPNSEMTPNRPDETPLESWKEIAAYLQRNAVTARRWEKEEGLPVHRHSHKRGNSVYAYPSQLDAWRRSRKVVAEPAPMPLWKIPAFALTILLCLLTVGNGVRPVSAEQNRGFQVRQLSGPDLDVEGSITPDGRYMAITTWDTGDLAVLDLSNGKIKRLNLKVGPFKDGDDWAEAPLISPDQKQLVYNWFDYAAQNYEFRIVHNQPGAKPRTLVRNPELTWFQHLAWSKDNSRVLMDTFKRDGSEQLVWISTSNGSMSTIKSLGRNQLTGASFSPDGRYILYSVTEGSDTSIHVLAPDGSGESTIMSGGINEFPVWTPDGSHAFFMSNRSGTFGLWAIAMQNGKASGAPHLVKGDIGRVSVMGLTSSGTLFYSHREGINNNYVADIDSATGKVRGPAKMISENFVGSNGQGAWSSDGKFIAFLRSPLGGNFPKHGNSPVEVVIRSVQSGEEKSYPSGQLSAIVPDVFWPKDSPGVLVPTRAPQGDHWVIHGVDPRTGEIKVAMEADIRFPNTSPIPSPDGKTVYFADRQSADGIELGVFAVSAATGQRKQIYRTPEGGRVHYRVLSVSPDGRRIAFLSSKQKDAPWELCTVSVDGSGFRELYTSDASQVLPGRMAVDWSPDGRSIYFALDVDKGANSRLMRIPAEGGTPEFTGLEMPRMHHVRVSPDGAHVAFGARDAAKQEFWALDNLLPALRSTR